MSDEQEEVKSFAEYADMISSGENFPVKLAGISNAAMIRKIRTVDFGKALVLLRAAFSAINLDDKSEMGLEAFAKGLMSDSDAVFDMVEKNFPHAIGLISTMTDLSTEEVEQMELDDLILVVGLLWQVNERFFTKRVATMFQPTPPVLTAAQ